MHCHYYCVISLSFTKTFCLCLSDNYSLQPRWKVRWKCDRTNFITKFQNVNCNKSRNGLYKSSLSKLIDTQYLGFDPAVVAWRQSSGLITVLSLSRWVQIRLGAKKYFDQRTHAHQKHSKMTKKVFFHHAQERLTRGLRRKMKKNELCLKIIKNNKKK